MLFAVNGGVASRDFNETIFRSIEKLIAKNSLYNTDIIEIAVCILENGYLVPATTSLFTQKHCEIVQKSYTAQQRKIVQAYDQAIKETPIINT
ncbi:MAG TPA: hypothetical protein EYG99_00560 [Candidatus Pacebacteria bacterium]|nr:hypothetical protein [Candidatus Paceibacterota bacterium]